MVEGEITREELYEKVWSTPMRKLAEAFGVSDVALSKLCRRLGVPTPGRGHWARVAAGKGHRRTPLPSPTPEQASARIRMGSPRPASPAVPKPVGPKPVVRVPRNLRRAHPAVQALALALQEASVDDRGRLSIEGRRGQVFVVTADHHRRALLILDGLAHALEDRGHAIAFVTDSGARGSLDVTVRDQTVSLSIFETLEKYEHKLTDDEQKQVAHGYRYGIPKYDYAPAGALRLSLVDARIGRSSWADSDVHRLEDHLGSAVLAIEAEAARRVTAAQEAERQRQAAEVLRLQQEEAARRARQQEERARQIAALEQDLRSLAERWRVAHEVKSFLEAVDAALVGEARSGEAETWLAWAREYARRIDPLSDPAGLPRRLPAGSAD